MIRSVSNPTLKGEIKKARASGYTFVKAMGDICDGGITMDGGKKNRDNTMGIRQCCIQYRSKR